MKHYSAVFSPRLESPGDVRDEVRACLQAWDASLLTGDAMLLSTELITGALLDGRGAVQFDVVLDDGSLTLSVLSGQRALASEVGGLPTPAGFGTLLIDRLADRWGIDPQPEGTRVWCELCALPPRETQAENHESG